MKREIFSGDVVQFITHREHQQACDWVGAKAKVNLWFVRSFDPESDIFTLTQFDSSYIVSAVEDELVKVADYEDIACHVEGLNIYWGEVVA